MSSHVSGAEIREEDAVGGGTRGTEEEAATTAAVAEAENTALPPSNSETSPADSPTNEEARADSREKTEDAFEKHISGEAGAKQIMGMMMKVVGELLNQQIGGS